MTKFNLDVLINHWQWLYKTVSFTEDGGGEAIEKWYCGGAQPVTVQGTGGVTELKGRYKVGSGFRRRVPGEVQGSWLRPRGKIPLEPLGFA